VLASGGWHWGGDHHGTESQVAGGCTGGSQDLCAQCSRIFLGIVDYLEKWLKVSKEEKVRERTGMQIQSCGSLVWW
jgi:hypothetical protein